MATRQQPSPIEQFLQPLHIDVPKCRALAKSLETTFNKLAKESKEQFLPTPITDSVLRPKRDGEGRYLAIDIGGTNLRVGFIELLSSVRSTTKKPKPSISQEELVQGGKESRVIRHLEKSWPIGDHLKNNQAEDLFSWIGGCIREVVRDGCNNWPGELPEEIPVGVTFSFPMIQHNLSSATLMAMGKGFAITSNLDLGAHLSDGYSSHPSASSGPPLPRIKISAIVNDAVATLVSFVYQLRHNPSRRPAMGLVVGTGTNATIPLALSKLHPSKRPTNLQGLNSEKEAAEPKITVNTEWTIKGAAAPLHSHNLITRWDAQLDAEGLAPGFQPFEYMTAGRYLGELGRLIILDYFTNHLWIPERSLPRKLVARNGLSTTFLGKVVSGSEAIVMLEEELPPPPPHVDRAEPFEWTAERADAVYQTAKAIQVRGSAMVAAAILGLLACADELDFSPRLSNGTHKSNAKQNIEMEELLVGYTGGCIVNFQDYLRGCQGFLDAVIVEKFGEERKLRVVLEPCHDGGILGAGILAGTVKCMMNNG